MATRIVTVFLVLFVVLVGGARALEDPAIVKDIEPGPEGSGPIGLAAFGNAVYFGASNTGDGYRAWRSDGTEAGTTLFIEGLPSGDFKDVGGTLYFLAFHPDSGTELWKSDGTEAGTMLVKDIMPGPGSSIPRSLTLVNGVLYFDAYDEGGRGLWKTDGTEAGTTLVKLIHPVPANFPLRSMTAAGGLLFFVANDGVHGRELWRSDGTEAGTYMVMDIYAGTFGSDPNELIEFDGRLYFNASTLDHGPELWRSDGSAANTVLVKDMYPGGTASNLEHAVVMGGALYFAANDAVAGRELWRSDGTAAGTTLVADVNPGPADSWPGWLTAAGTTLLFVATDPVHGQELWRSDGTAAGTVLVEDINPGPADSNVLPYGELPFEAPDTLTTAGGTAFFMADDGTHGYEPWRSDGTAAGTELIADIYPGPFSSGPAEFTVVGQRIFFAAQEPATGRELWSLEVSAPTTADLSITLAVSEARPPIDSDVTFRVTLNNAGPVEATGVEVRVPLPAGLVVQDASGGVYDPGTGLWTVGAVPDGGSTSLTLVARVADPAPASVVAEVVAADQPDPDSVPANGAPGEDDQATALVTPRLIADLSLSLAASSLEPVAGSNVTLMVTLANDGPAEAVGVTVRVPLPPAGLRFVSANPSAGYQAATGVWTVGSVPAGAVAGLSVVATVISLVAVDVAAEVTAAGTFDPDSTPGNGLPGEDDYGALRLVPRSGGIVVNHNGSEIDPNDGRCTLREAITAANTDTISGPMLGECAAGFGPDVIQMRADPPVHSHSVVDNDTNGAIALPVIYTDITVEGHGAVIERSAVAGTPDLRLFVILSNGALTLKNATVRGARSSYCAGFWNSGTLSLHRTTVSGNVATVAPGALVSGGGGICSAGTLTITESTISGNQAADTGPLPGRASAGGGLFILAGTSTLTSTTVGGNKATSRTLAAGGGIHVQLGARLSLVDSHVVANTVSVASPGAGTLSATGGGISAISSASLTMTRATVIDNRVSGGSVPTGQHAAGGGLWLSDVTAALTDCTIRGNTAGSGGGLMAVDGATVAISGGSITANVANGIGLPFGNGGGLSNGWNVFSAQRPGGTVTLDQVLVDSNQAPTGGGAGVYTRGPLTLTRVTLSKNTASTKGGGLLLVDDAPVTVIASTITLNVASEGGGLLKRDTAGGPLTVDGTTIVENQAQRGGGIELDQAASPTAVTTVRGNTKVENNRATLSHGGGISLLRGTLVLEDGAVSRNAATIEGGGLYLSAGEARLTRSTVDQNSAVNSGGGIWNGAGSTLALVESVVAGNKARLWAGLANWGGSVTLTGSTVTANQTNFWGGGGIGNSGTMTLIGSSVTANEAGPRGNGGGIEQNQGATLTLDNSTVSRNTASHDGGGVALIQGPSTAILRNGTSVSDNVASGSRGGGGLYGESGARFALTQTQVRGNRAPDGWGGGINNTGNQSVLTITGSLIAGNTATTWGGVANDGTTTLTDTTVSGNTTTVGGGAGIGNRGRLTLRRSTVRGNTTGPNGFGGGIEQFGGGSVTLVNSTLSANTASLGGGGLGMIFGASSATLRNGSVVADNVADGIYGGGGIDADPGTIIDIADSDIRGNRAPFGAGGGIHTQGRLTLRRSAVGTNSAVWGAGITIWNAGSRLDLLNSRVHANQTTSDWSQGGGILFVSRVLAVLRDSHIEGNTSAFGGGMMVYPNNDVITVDRVAISRNVATDSGGGAFMAPGAVVRFVNSTVSGNQASAGGGFFLSPVIPAAQLTLTYSTVTDNDAEVGGGLHAALGANASRSILAGNLQGGNATGASADCFAAVAGGGANLVGAGTGCPATGNSTIAPADVFSVALGPLADNGGPTPTHELLPGSPAIDASRTACTGSPVNGVDQRAIVRPRDGDGSGGAACDLGAFER